MSQHPIEGLMDVTLEKIKSMVDSNTIIGNPINMADGTLVLPISKVTFGFASGGADFPSFFLQILQPLRKRSSIKKSGWRISSRNSFSLV